jgi:hypothetical protein
VTTWSLLHPTASPPLHLTTSPRHHVTASPRRHVTTPARHDLKARPHGHFSIPRPHDPSTSPPQGPTALPPQHRAAAPPQHPSASAPQTPKHRSTSASLHLCISAPQHLRTSAPSHMVTPAPPPPRLRAPPPHPLTMSAPRPTGGRPLIVSGRTTEKGVLHPRSLYGLLGGQEGSGKGPRSKTRTPRARRMVPFLQNLGLLARGALPARWFGCSGRMGSVARGGPARGFGSPGSRPIEEMPAWDRVAS